MAHILLPTDFSDNSLNACQYALALFGSAGHQFTLVHTYMDPVPGYAEMVDMTSALYAASVEGLAGFTERFRALKGVGQAVVSDQGIYGPLATALAKFSRERSVDVIVMANQGAGGMALFGSNTGAMARASHVPVLIVPKNAHFNGLRRILFADDHTRVERLAMRLLVKVAKQYDAEILIAHVLRSPTEEPDPQVVADYDVTLADVKHRYIDATGDDVALALSNVAERDGVDLLSVLHRHMGFLESLFHGSVAKRMAMHSGVPLLVLEH